MSRHEFNGCSDNQNILLWTLLIKMLKTVYDCIAQQDYREMGAPWMYGRNIG